MAEKPLVFIVHGMGSYEKGWSKEAFINPLNRLAQNYEYFKGKKLENLIDFEEVTYDSHFRKVLDNWENNSKKILDLATPTEKEMVGKALGWMEGISAQEENFVWTHITDVLLWVVAPYLKKIIKNNVAEQITRKIIDRMEKSPIKDISCNLVCHSLGTAVSHDTLAEIATGAWQQGGNGFDPAFFRFNSLHTVANVSKILETSQYPVYERPIQPGPAGDPDSYCKHFYNYHHEWDPFTWVRPFKPGWDKRFFHDKPVSHFYDWNTHGLAHYLEHYRVHIMMLRSFLGYAVISGDEERKAPETFSEIKPEVQEKVDGIKERAKHAREEMGDSPDLIDFMKGIYAFFSE